MLIILALVATLSNCQSPVIYTLGSTIPRLDRATIRAPHSGWATITNEENSECNRKTPMIGAYTGCGISPAQVQESKTCTRGNIRNKYVTANTEFFLLSPKCYFVLRTALKLVSDQRGLKSGLPVPINSSIPLYFVTAPTNNSLLVVFNKGSSSLFTCEGECVDPTTARMDFVTVLPKAGAVTIQVRNPSPNLDLRVFPASQLGVEEMRPEPRQNRLYLTNGVSGTFRIFVENTEDVMIFASYTGSNCSSEMTPLPTARHNCKSSLKDSTTPNMLIIDVEGSQHIFYTIEAIRPGKVLKVKTEFIPIRKPSNGVAMDLKLEHPEHFEVAVSPKSTVSIRVEVISSRGGSFQLFSTNTAATGCTHRTSIFPREGVSCDTYQFTTNATLVKYFVKANKIYFSLFARKTPDVRITVTHTPLFEISESLKYTFTAFTEGIYWTTFKLSKLQFTQMHIHVVGTQDDRLEFYQTKWCNRDDPTIFPTSPAEKPDNITLVKSGSLTLRIREHDCQYFIGVVTSNIASTATLVIDPIVRKRLAAPQTQIQFTPGSLRELFFYKMIDGTDKREFIITTSYPDAVLFVSRSDLPTCTESDLEFPSDVTPCSIGGKNQLTMSFSSLTRLDIGVFLSKPHTEPFFLIVTPKETCGSGRFFNPTSESCSPCPLGCTECADYQGCVACSLGSLFYNGLCVSTCPKGSFANGPRCTECPVNCASCSSDFSCLECKAGTSLIDGACRAGCPIGTFLSNGHCLKCQPGCLSCKDSYVCLRCDEQHTLAGDACKQTCHEGYFKSEKGCTPCATSCSHCTSATKCQRCNQGYHLSENSCLATCPIGTYASGIQCLKCSEHCSECNTYTECVQCNQGFELSDDLSCEKNEKQGWVNYNRCNPRWAAHLVGSSRVTICQGGGLLTAMAMVFSTWRANCQGICDPANLNEWLRGHGGYTGFRINHQAVDKLGLIYLGTYSDSADWVPHVNQGHAVILFMKSVRQWVVVKTLVSGRIEGQSSSAPSGLYDHSDVETAIIYIRKHRT